MSQFSPPNLSASDVVIASKPALGGEFVALLSAGDSWELGVFQTQAANSGVWTPDAYAASQLLANPNNLVVVAETSVKDTGDIVITVNGTDQNGANLSATATIAPINWAKNQSVAFPTGTAWDVLPGDLTKKFKTILSISIACTQVARGASFKVMSLPDISTFTEVGYTNDKNFNTRAPEAEAIQDRLDESAAVKPGMRPKGELTIKSKYVTLGDGMAKFAGVRCVAALELRKENLVLTERLIFTGFVPMVKPSAGNGKDQSDFDASGIYEKLAIFIAQSS